MSRNSRKKLMTAAIPASYNVANYGNDYIQTETPVAIQTRSLGITPIEGDSIDRELDDGKLGLSPELMVGTHVKSSGEIEIAGSGDVDTPVAYAHVLTCSGFDPISTLDTHVQYLRNDGVDKDATFYVYMDGAYHIMTGARGTIGFRLAVGEIPSINYELTGLYGGVSAGAMPSADFTPFQTPVKVGFSNTTLTLSGTEYKMLEFELSENNEIVYDENTVDEQIYLVDFAPEGRLLIEAEDISTFDPFSLALSETIQNLEVTHGTATGNTFRLWAKIQLGRTTYADRNGRIAYEIPFRVIGNTGIETR